MDWRELYDYAKSVGGYWWAIFGWVTFVTGDGANWFGLKEALDKRIPAKLRRNLEILIMVALVFYAGFEAWNDQYQLADKMGHRLQYWRDLAEARRQQIEGRDGYGGLKAALKKVQDALPKGDSQAIQPQHKLRLARLVAYEGPALEFKSIGTGYAISGFSLPVHNVSADTLEIYIDHLSIGVNQEKPAEAGPFKKSILPQTQTMPWHIAAQGSVLTPLAKTVTVEFEVNYDTIPATGLRRSFRKIVYSLDWSNGASNLPTQTGSIEDQWER